MEDLGQLLAAAPFSIIAAVIDKTGLVNRQAKLDNPYHLALRFCLERLHWRLNELGAGAPVTHLVFEKRGKREDQELELEFYRICAGANEWQQPLRFTPVFADKKTNSSGLQLADLVARPIGLSVLRPDQPNRAFDILKTKFVTGPDGAVEGWGLQKW